MEYRHELKFVVTEMELAIIRCRLLPLMELDSHQKGEAYTVRSLYFDDCYDSCMRENEDGVDNRSKFRIRIYDGSSEVIKLEKKSKCRGMTQKVSTEISKEECLRYMAGQAPLLTQRSSELVKYLYCEIKMHGMKPKSIVEYERTAFVEKRGNVRVTFDRNIRGSTVIPAFLDRSIAAAPLLPVGQHVLEVKYDELLPQHIAQMLELGTLQRTSFSKYFYSRNEPDIN